MATMTLKGTQCRSYTLNLTQLCQVSVLTHKHHTQKTEAIDFRFLFYSLTK